MNNPIPPHLKGHDPQEKLQADFEAMNRPAANVPATPKSNLQAEFEAMNRPAAIVATTTQGRLPGTATSRIAARRRQARRKNHALNALLIVVLGGFFLIAMIALLIAYAAGGFLNSMDAPPEVESGVAALITAEIVIYGTIAVIGLIGFGIWLYALVDLVGRPFEDSNQKLVWVLVIVLCGTVGAIIYLMMGDEQTRSSSRVRRY